MTPAGVAVGATEVQLDLVARQDERVVAQDGKKTKEARGTLDVK